MSNGISARASLSLPPSLPFSLGLGRGQKVGVIELKVKSSNFKKCGIKSGFFFFFNSRLFRKNG